MADPIRLDGLQIIGYADVLAETMLPSVVPPVFQSKAEPNRILLPPYHMNAGFLYNATEVCEAELKNLADDQEVTLFSLPPWDAKKEYDLWVDQSFVPRYESRSKVTETLLSIADKNIAEAEEALRAGDLERADRLSGIAACADDRRLAPFAIQAAIERAKGNKAGEQLMAELAASIAGGHSFEATVNYYPETIPRSNLRPMHNVAMKPDRRKHPRAA